MVYLWRRRGRAGEEPYATFTRALKNARALATLDMVAAIRQAAATDWKAAAWYLEHVEPEIYADRLEVRVSPTRLSRLAAEAGVSEGEMAAEIARLQRALVADDEDA